MLRIAWLLAFSVFVLGSCETDRQKSLPYFNTPDFTPHFFTTPAEVDKKITHTIGEFNFRNQYGGDITDKNIVNKIHIANFIFTSCSSICPVMTNHMKLVNEAFGNDSSVVMLSYSVTPWIDDVQQLKTYTDRNAITTSNWHFLTGKKSEIYALARQSYFAEEDLGFTRDSTEFLHTEHFILVDQSKRIRGIYNGTLELDIRQLIDDIKILKATE